MFMNIIKSTAKVAENAKLEFQKQTPPTFRAVGADQDLNQNL